ncbi:MAG: tRNA lysidine(34) synthetase TilS [Pseudomonadota bacterium]
MADLVRVFDDCAGYDAVVLAVSGGSDSMAMLQLFADWRASQARSPRTHVVTVDHGLRPEAAAEARAVAARCAALGLPHATLTWDRDGQRRSMAAARDARYRLIVGDALARDPYARWAVLTAHTQDDQIETAAMRLARGASLDGVAGMRRRRALDPFGRCDLLRPLLGVTRDRLRAILLAAGVSWCDDPTNDNAAFERTRVRAALGRLSDAGIEAAALARTVARLGAERDALDALVAERLASDAVVAHAGLWAAIRCDALQLETPAFAIRVLMRLADRLGGAGTADGQWADFAQCADRIAAAGVGAGREPSQWTLARCLFHLEEDWLWIAREPARRAAPLPTVALQPGLGTGVIWDRRLLVVCGDDVPGGLSMTLASPLLNAASGADLQTTLTPLCQRPPAVSLPIWRAACASAPALVRTEKDGAVVPLWTPFGQNSVAQPVRIDGARASAPPATATMQWRPLVERRGRQGR